MGSGCMNIAKWCCRLGALRYHATLVPTGTRAALLALVGALLPCTRKARPPCLLKEMKAILPAQPAPAGQGRLCCACLSGCLRPWVCG